MALNLGGGFGARYTKDDHPMAVRDIVGLIVKHTEEKFKGKWCYNFTFNDRTR